MNTSILILAGGKSSRMNYKDKACLPLGNDTFLSSMYKRMSAHSAQIIIGEGAKTQREYEECMKNACFVRDIYENNGPLGGLHAALLACNSEYLCVAACDMPNLQYDLYEHLLERDQEKYDAIIPTLEGRKQPLAGIYKKRVLPKLEVQLKQEENTVKFFLDKLEVCYVEMSDNNDLVAMLENVNTTEDYKELNRNE